ncbi:MAG: type II secretion system F family protein [Syntrophotaleaceae bacterium]
MSLVGVIFLAWSESKFAEKHAIKKRLYYISAGGKHGQEKLRKYRERVLKDVGAFESLALKIPRVSSLDRLLLKTKLPLNASTFIIGTLALATIGTLLGLKLFPQTSAAFGLGLILLVLPYIGLRIAEKNYYNKFQEQLPEALDLLARALRSGHALTSGLEMVATEMEDPIRSEIGAAVDEINLGLTFQEAFENLCARVPSTDLRFFTISVLIQRETGGNIAEILDNISRLIRERIQSARQVQALTAEGRYSAGVLICLPLVLFLYIYFVNYNYLSLLWSEDLGKLMLLGAVISQLIGAYLIKRIVTIEI